MRNVLVVTAALLLSCAPAMEPVGVTPAHAYEPQPSATASASTPAWRHATAVPGLAKANAKRFPSAGHLFGRYDADVLVNEAAKAPYASIAPGSSAPVGALVVQRHFDHDGTPGPVFAMEKGANGWSYVELDARLHVKREGRISPCVDCHTHVASQDELFGVPASGR